MLPANKLSRVHALKPAVPAFTEAVYIGNDWLLYATDHGSHDAAEMIAPCLILSQCNDKFTIHCDSASLSVNSHVILHGSGLSTHGEGNLALFIYFDPLSPAGLRLQHLAASAGGLMDFHQASEHLSDATALEDIVQGGMSCNSMQAFVNDMSQILSPLEAVGKIDQRLQKVTRVIRDKPDGRPDLDRLGEMVHMSGDNLRRLFCQTTGTTLSRYQMWQRLRHMVLCACERQQSGKQPTMEEMVFAAGFYDMPHAAKTIKKFLARKTSSIVSPVLFKNCCTPNC
ncbi:AraC family transcriptional regulator [Leeia oryzae]|uniref:AraC family transcriptional regulator n=1 Tax=Leeia oryzae TaxID=356662 RepID=UPI00037D2775|nr:AraC family transcriptional regulator [Leeia oryzae]